MTINHPIKIAASQTTEAERGNRHLALDLLRQAPIPDDELLRNLGLFLNRQAMSRILTIHELYRNIIEVHGAIMEFGVRWGQNLALFESFRGMYEPFNLNRTIIGFDTFEGFAGVSEKDGSGEIISPGSYAVAPGYEDYLRRLLDYHESESPIAHIKKYELVKGDVSTTLPEYLKANPHTVIALAYFDMDIYEPTRNCLALIKERLTRGSVIGFDELNNKTFPGETRAVMEVLGLSNLRLRRFPNSSDASYAIVE